MTGMVRLAIALFLTYLAVAMPLAVIPPFVTGWPGYSTFLAGVSVGCSFFSTLLTRGRAGRFCDQLGSDRSLHRGLLLYAIGCFLCALSAVSALPLTLRFGMLILGRLTIGVGESYTMVGVHIWGIGLEGHERSGRVLSLTGMAMYAAYAVGGPSGLWIYHHWNFAVLMLICMALPGLGFILTRGLRHVPPSQGTRRSFIAILSAIKWHGAGVALQGVGFAVLGAYIALTFHHRHWGHGGLGLTFFGLAFVANRLLLGATPDKFGGLPIALGSLLFEAAGLACISVAATPVIALFGAALAGGGCSMVYPALGRDVVRVVSPDHRALALGGFAAFQDVAYAFTAPIAGALVDGFGYGTVFMLAAFSAVIGAFIVIGLMMREKSGSSLTA
ncbi:putative MFS-type transporter [Acetobacteraceae bacterium EV16G]|uniref:MFS-type transporter n=2 Tax=Sorlinia euscelidii TaxID=3081148 RepID=A0ABU7U421_9PROT